MKVGAALSAPVSCLSRTQTVGVGKRNQNWFLAVRGARTPPAARLRPRFARKKHTELVCRRRRRMLFRVLGVYMPAKRTQLQTDCVVDQLIRLINGSALFSRHTGLRRVSRFVESKAFGSIPTGGEFSSRTHQLLRIT